MVPRKQWNPPKPYGSKSSDGNMHLTNLWVVAHRPHSGGVVVGDGDHYAHSLGAHPAYTKPVAALPEELLVLAQGRERRDVLVDGGSEVRLPLCSYELFLHQEGRELTAKVSACASLAPVLSTVQNRVAHEFDNLVVEVR